MGKLNTPSEIVQDYERWLHWKANRLLPPAHPDHDDLVQEGRIAIWRATCTHDPAKGALPSWVTRAAIDRMTDVAWHQRPSTGHAPMRGSRPAQTRLMDPEFWDSLEQHWSFVGHADDAIWAYHRGEIRQALDRLTPDQRRYVVLRFWGGLEPSAGSGGQLALRRATEMPSRAWEGQAGVRQELEYALRHLNPFGD